MTVDLMSATFFRPEGPLPAAASGSWSAFEPTPSPPEAHADAALRRGDLWSAMLRRIRARVKQPASH